MTTLFVTRHQGARDWADLQNFKDAEAVEHLSAAKINALGKGDIVIGTLPVHIIAQINRRRARYFHLEMAVPLEARGRDLSAEDMARFGAKLEEFIVTKVEPGKELP